MRRLSAIAALSVLLAAGCGGSGTTAQSEASPANKLVEVARSEHVPATDPEVLTVQRHLESLGGKCEQSEATLATLLQNALGILSKKGKGESAGALTQALDTAAPGKGVVPDCKGILAALLVKMEG